jgi:hypothetical protein
MAGGQCIPPTLIGVGGGGRVEFAEQPQPGQPAVGIHVQTQVRGRGGAVEQQAVPGVGLNRGAGHDLLPSGEVGEIGFAGVDGAQADPSGRVPDVVAGVDFRLARTPGGGEDEYRVVVTVTAASCVLPAFAHVAGTAGQDDVRR